MELYGKENCVKVQYASVRISTFLGESNKGDRNILKRFAIIPNICYYYYYYYCYYYCYYFYYCYLLGLKLMFRL